LGNRTAYPNLSRIVEYICGVDRFSLESLPLMADGLPKIITLLAHRRRPRPRDNSAPSWLFQLVSIICGQESDALGATQRERRRLGNTEEHNGNNSKHQWIFREQCSVRGRQKFERDKRSALEFCE
jgi:hypothetical protein